MTRWVAAFDGLLWPMMQLGVAKLFVSLPDRSFDRVDPTCGRSRRLELWLYRRVLLVKRWKHSLPDGGGWVGSGFSKKTIRSHCPEYVRRFVLEARRGEATHWTAMACAGLFLPWNPPRAWPFLVGLAVLLNAPCIVVQRYNRIALERRLSTGWRAQRKP